MTTGLYTKTGCYIKGDDFSKAQTKLEVERQVQQEITNNTAPDHRSYTQKRFYLQLPDDKEKPRVGFFELGFLVTTGGEEARVGELVAIDDLPPSEGGTIKIVVRAPQTIPLDGMEAISPYGAPVEIREFRIRYWGPEFLKIMAWERIR